MKAIVYTQYGSPDVLALKKVPKPAPKGHEVLIKLAASAVNSGDTRIRAFNVGSPLFWLPGRLVFGLTGPRKPILGTSLSGTVEAIGKGVTLFKIGDEVFGSAGMGFGTHAEYVCVSEKGALALKPNNMSHQQSAAIPFGGFTALHFLSALGHIQKGQKVLIYGASGAVGTMAIQLGKYYGAHVTAVCSGTNSELVKSLGADKVIDYTREDYSQLGDKYDLVFDTVGKTSFAQAQPCMTEHGRYVSAVMNHADMLQILKTSFSGKQKALGGVTTENTEDLLYLKDLAEAGKLKPVIEKTYPLEQTAEAHRHVDGGHKKGNVVISIG